MAPEWSKVVRRVTFALLTCSAVAVEIAAVDTRPVWASVGLALVWVGIAAGVAALMPLPRHPRGTPSTWVFLLLLALGLAPFFVEPLRRQMTGEGYPLELQMVLALRNVGLGLAACAGWLLCLRLAAIVSLFLTLFSAAMTNHPGVLVCLGLYTATGSIWLMLVYWNGLKQVFVTPDRLVAVEVQATRERLPWPAFVIAAAMFAVVGLLIVVGPQSVARTLGEWLPTSGGTGGYDPFARGGVNDGDDETTGNNPQSTGMTKTDSFLDSPLPSLYDVMNDMLGEPFKPNPEQERAIALDPSTKVGELDKKPADNLRPNREFPTHRRSPRQVGTPSDRSARAMFEIYGRTPLHLRVVAYDRFDGRTWHEAPVNRYTSWLEKDHNSNWMLLRERALPSYFAQDDRIEIKVTRPEGALIPTPPHLTRFRIGKVDRVDFFAWSQDRILKFADRTTPSGIIVETECHTVDYGQLDSCEFPSTVAGTRFEYLTLPPSWNPELTRLAQEWTRGLPRGWPQISAVIEHLRQDYIYDPQHRWPESESDPLSAFLLRDRRGPDYQFASAATLLLRALGYPTRFLSGLYGDPKHYDPMTRHTPVGKDDLHFWPEVFLPTGDWLVLEPTPGYEVIGPKRPLLARLWAWWLELMQWAWEHIGLLSLGTITLTSVWRLRKRLWDRLAVLRWRWFPAAAWQQRVLAALRILERRARWAGVGRRPQQTIADWFAQQVVRTPALEADLRLLRDWSNWAAYAPQLPPPWPEAEANQVCKRLLTTWKPAA